MKVTPGSICWACGAPCNRWYSSPIDGGRRCTDCWKKQAPLDPQHIGKQSELDKLQLATKQRDGC